MLPGWPFMGKSEEELRITGRFLVWVTGRTKVVTAYIENSGI